MRARQWADRPEIYTEVDESTELEVQLPSGATAYGKASRFDSENLLRVEAERGWYQLQPMQAYTGVRGQTSDGKDTFAHAFDGQQARQMDAEALAILEGRPPVVPGEDQRDVRIIEPILRSAQTNAPVEL